MQILSDWQTGKPPMVGMWLCRRSEVDSQALLMWWNGSKWYWTDNDFESLDQRWQWRGLAFDPERVCELTALGADRINFSTRRDRIYVVQVKR